VPEQSGSARHDRFDRALEDHQIPFIAGAADDVVTAARRAGWRRLVVAGDPRLTAPLVGAVPETAGLEVLTVDGIHEWERPAQLAEAMAPALAESQARRAEALVADPDADPDVLARAFVGSGQVVIAPPEALTDAGGVAAVLRW
jgi:hypothetical protein